jgi:hypothetical protein
VSYEAWGDGDDHDGYVTEERAAEMVNEATAALLAELAEARMDAQRYRWLLTRDPQEFLTDATGINCWMMDRKAEFDAAIDAAISEERQCQTP